MKSRRHRAIEKAKHKEFLSELERAEKFLQVSGFTKVAVKEAVRFPYQRELMKRMLRGGRGEAVLARNTIKGGRAEVLGVDYGAEDKSVITHAQLNEDGTVKVLAVEEF